MTRTIIEERNILKMRLKQANERIEEQERIISKTQKLLRDTEKENKMLKRALELSEPLSKRTDLDGTGGIAFTKF